MKNKPNPKHYEPDLSPRQMKILFTLVKEYCDTGETIGSSELRDKYNFEFSPATIRNELVVLRNKEYLYQPFVNSPSQPTEKSFKLFINQLIVGLGQSNRRQNDLQDKILELQDKHNNLSKEIARLISEQTSSVGFSLTNSDQSIAGVKHLIDRNFMNNTDSNQSIEGVLDFLDNIDQHKNLLVDSNLDENITTVFGGDSKSIPLSKGYTLVATKVNFGDEKAVIGLISPTHLLASSKKIQAFDNLQKEFNKQAKNHKK
jgi:transcriptional regulator of heat shock response